MKGIFKRALHDLRRGWEAPVMLTVIFLVIHYTIEPPNKMTIPDFLVALIGGTALGLVFLQVWPPELVREMHAQRSSARRRSRCVEHERTRRWPSHSRHR